MPPCLDLARVKRAYIVDDDLAFRRSLEMLLKTAGWQVQGFGCSRDFLERCPNLEPGLLLLDLHLPGESGLEILERGPKELNSFGCVVMTGAGEIQAAVRSLQAGAFDFVEKPFDAETFLEKLESVIHDFWQMFESDLERRDARRRVEQLSKRERDVLAGIAAGGSNKVIGRALNLSARTVEMHRARLLAKLAAKGTSDAVRIAVLADLAERRDEKKV